MQRLGNELLEEVKEIIREEAEVVGTLPAGMRKDVADGEYWINVLKTIKWECCDGNIESGKKRFLKNPDMFAEGISVKTVRKPLMAVYVMVSCDREKESESIVKGYERKEMKRSKNDFPYMIDRFNLEKRMDSLLSVVSVLDNVVYSVSTIWGENIPPCTYCEGTGEEPCRYCDGTGWVICDTCGGEAGRRTKTCSHCDGTGKIHCPECKGEGMKVCAACHGSGKSDNKNCTQIIKRFNDKYVLSGNMKVLVPAQNTQERKRGDEADFTDKNLTEAVVMVINQIYMQDWLSSLQISRLYSAPGHLVEDNSGKIREDILSEGGEPMCMLYDSFQDEVKSKIDDNSTVCVVENYYPLSPMTIVKIRYNVAGYKSDIEIFAWEDLIWCNSLYAGVSWWQLFFKRIFRKRR